MYRLLPVLALGLLAANQPPPRSRVLSVSIDGVIHPVTVGILDNAIRQAQRQQCSLLLIRLNTPGGFADATRAATEKLLASPVPIATWVGPADGHKHRSSSSCDAVGKPDPTLLTRIENDTAAFFAGRRRSSRAERSRGEEGGQPAAIQLRYLQTLVEIGTERNTTVVFPLPVDILSAFSANGFSSETGANVAKASAG